MALELQGFGTIRNNTALKRKRVTRLYRVRFWNHSKQHSSKTQCQLVCPLVPFWNHSKQHSSKTRVQEAF